MQLDFNQAARNLYGPIVERKVHPMRSGTIRLTVDSVVEPTPTENHGVGGTSMALGSCPFVSFA